MKKIIVIALIIFIGYQLWHFLSSRFGGLEPLYEEPYIVVYGRDTCGWTQRYLRDLGNENKIYIYKDIDRESVRNELLDRMKKVGLNTSYFKLPVIKVNAKLFIRPELKTVLAKYEKPLAKTARKEYKKKEIYEARTLEVTGIVMGKEPFAIVDGNVVKYGDKVGDFYIQEIREDHVKFRSTDGKILIKRAE